MKDETNSEKSEQKRTSSSSSDQEPNDKIEISMTKIKEDVDKVKTEPADKKFQSF